MKILRGFFMGKSTSNSERVGNTTASSPEELISLLFEDLAKILILAPVDEDVICKAFETRLRKAAEKRPSATTVEVLGSAQRDCMEIMCAWRRLEGYLDKDAEPIALQFDGGSPSFEALCKEVGAKAPAEQLRDLLISFKAVGLDEGGTLRALTPTFLASEKGSHSFVAVDTAVRQLIGFTNTVACNVATDSPKRFERSCTVTVPEELAPIFERLVKERGQVLIDSLDEWLERRRNESSECGRYVQLGVGVYTLFE
ncbi:MAG: DUF6502 family protein [Steroidobacteraceae bacterium]